MEMLHELSLWALYAALALACFFSVERAIFYFSTQRDFTALHGWIAQPRRSAAAPVKAASVAGRLLAAAESELAASASREQVEDASERAYIRANRELNRHLWVFDTVVTAAPLLGLLGTILGIFDTFTALAKSGISDPQGVSAGIGSALLATALGIGVALVCLLVYNFFLQRVEHLVDDVKLALLELSSATPRPA